MSALLRAGWHALPYLQFFPASSGFAACTRNLSALGASSSDDHSDQARFESIIQGFPSSTSSQPLEPTSSTAGSRLPDRPVTRPKLQTLRSDRTEDLHLDLVSDDYGYAVLGGVNPDDTSADWGLGTPRVHPQRLFNPGETYTPEDLNPFYKSPGVQKQNFQRKSVAQWSKQELYEQADYKNVPFLEQFVSDAGRLLPRKKTKLKPAYHKHVMRQIKIARVLALMPHETRIGDEQRKRLKQFEMLQSQQRAALQVESAPAAQETAVV